MSRKKISKKEYDGATAAIRAQQAGNYFTWHEQMAQWAGGIPITDFMTRGLGGGFATSGRFIAGADPYDALIEEVDVAVIHEDFRSVADKLLEEAKEIINKAKPDDRVNRYKKLGFGGIKRVKEHDAAYKEKAEREKVLNKINEYRIKYPTCQFIDSESLDKLCKKYGLVYAPAEYFNQEIPEENLREIEAFELKKEDYIKEFWTDQFPHVTPHKGSDTFEVVATKDMFDVPSGFEFHGSTLRAKVPDPIILKRVPLGFLIITAWGPEAQLPEVNIDRQ